MLQNFKFSFFIVMFFVCSVQAEEGPIAIELCEDIYVSANETKVIALITDTSLVAFSPKKEPLYIIGKGRRLEGLIQFVWSHVALYRQGKYVSWALKKPFSSSLKASSASFKKGVILLASGREELLKDALQRLQANPFTQKGKNFNEPLEAPDVVMNSERHVDASTKKLQGYGGFGRTKADTSFIEKGKNGLADERHKGHTLKNAGVHSSHTLRDDAQKDSSGRRMGPAAPSPSHMRDGSTVRPLQASLLQGGIQPMLRNDGVRVPQISASQPLASAQISVEMVKEGCNPRIDEAQGKVFIQMKIVTKRNGAVIDQTECRDSHMTFAIQKDYLCEQCADYVDSEHKRAFSRYQKYWMDNEGRRQIIQNGRLYVDETRPYPFHNEREWCRPSIDLQSMQAHGQVETVYYNRFNSRQLVKPCHVVEGSRVPITLTSEGCTPVHDFAGNRSKERKRAVFTLDNVEHVASPCQEVGAWIAHEFVKADCRPSVDLQAHTVVQTMRRRIQTSAGPQLITVECEPYGNALALQQTKEGCEGQYVHDFEGNKSYLKKRWFHTLKPYPKYVTGCLQSDEFLPHLIETKGYVHNDETKTSTAKTAIFIQAPQERQEISPAQVRPQNPTLAYVFQEEKLVASTQQPSFYEGCHKITPRDNIHVFKRVDESIYELRMGEGVPLRGPDECHRAQEKRYRYLDSQYYEHGRGYNYADKRNTGFSLTYINGHWITGGYFCNDRYVLEQRTMTTFPTGERQEGSWERTNTMVNKPYTSQFVEFMAAP